MRRNRLLSSDERIPSLAEYCFIAQAERLDQLSHRRRKAPWTPAEFLDNGRAKRLKYFVNVQLRNRTDAALSFAGTKQLPNEILKNDTGRDLRSVSRNFIEEAVAIVILIEIAEAEFGIDAPSNVTAERAVGLHGDI